EKVYGGPSPQYIALNKVDVFAREVDMTQGFFLCLPILQNPQDAGRKGRATRKFSRLTDDRRHRMKKYRILARIQAVVLLALFVAVGIPAFAQVEKGRFVGRIADPQGAVVPNASVKATNIGTNITQSAETNSTGEFVITPVSAGQYKLTVSASGFKTITTSDIEVDVGQIVREDLTLQVGSSTTTIEVTTETSLINTDSATMGTIVSNQQLSDLPLNGRGFFQLAELTPGAALLAPTGNSLAIRPEVVNGNTISGVHGFAMSFLLDGVDVTEQHQ